MTVVAPSTDPQGALIDAQIVVLQALVNANLKPMVLPQYVLALNQTQVEAVDHYMVTGWLNAAYVLANFSAPANDRVGQALTTRVAFLQNLTDNAPAMPPGNNGWTSLAAEYGNLLYAAQISLVEHIMDVPGGTSAATILATLTGYQSFPFEYVFDSVGYTDVDEDD